MNTPSVTHERLLELLDYDPASGIFIYRMAPTNRVKAGAVAGFRQGDYLGVSIAKQTILLHRLAWFYVYGEWPSQFIDHINHKKTDNRISNLRKADKILNGQNRAGPQSNNRTGLLGVSPYRGKWKAQISFNGKNRQIGLYSSPVQAATAYQAAKSSVHAAVYEV